ncbi:MAG: hypothetical protein J0G33_02905 [Afipia felis]|nr:hypothetical protein [Afipia felis]
MDTNAATKAAVDIDTSFLKFQAGANRRTVPVAMKDDQNDGIPNLVLGIIIGMGVGAGIVILLVALLTALFPPAVVSPPT